MIEALRIFHGLYNAAVMVAFFFMAALGWRIRRARLSKAPLPVASVRRHRGRGPVLVILGVIGFLVGLIVILIDTGKLLEYPVHLVVGLGVVALLVWTYVISRKIKGPDSPARTPHFVLGVSILVLYLVQAFLGLRMLLG